MVSREFYLHFTFEKLSSTSVTMRTVVEILTVENKVFANFVAYASIIVVKMMILSPYTGLKRMLTRVRCCQCDLGLRITANPIDFQIKKSMQMCSTP